MKITSMPKGDTGVLLKKEDAVLRLENKVKDIRYYHIVRHLDICKFICINIIKTPKRVFSVMSNFQTDYHFN